jgi:hypothetical protein
MSKIVKHDTDGTKGVLAKGELGYDDYPAGGDAGRVYVGDGTNSIAQAKLSELEEVQEVLGTGSDVRYDKKLSSLDVIEMVYDGNSNLTATRYAGDNDTDMFFRDVLSYTGDDLTEVKHYFGTANLTTENASTVLTYSNGSLATAEYSEV